MKMSQKLNTNSGYSLAELMISISVAAIVLAGVGASFSLLSNGNIQRSMNFTKEEIVNKIRVQSINSKNLIASAKVTSALGPNGLPDDYGPISTLKSPDLLEKCHPDMKSDIAAKDSCNKTVLEEPGKGFLFYLSENESEDPNLTIAGEDVYYTTTGKRCSGTDAKNADLCPLEAHVWFEPNCLNFDLSCNKAISLIVRYKVGLRPDYSSSIGTTATEGELYVPLQRGIQIKNVLSQSNITLSPNSKNIFVIPKYFGTDGQTISGLRFEGQVTNPAGLTTMRLQMRSLVGPAARLVDDQTVPSTIESESWVDVANPEGSSLGAWSINLSGAATNQVFNFGTQASILPNSRTPVSFPVGKSLASGLDPIYHWTLNDSKTAYVAPQFKSGFYQFRIVATDIYGQNVISTNFANIRIVPTPQFQIVPETFSLERDCVNKLFNYTIFVGDDEYLTFNEVKINDTVISTTNKLSTTDGTLQFDFSLDQPAGNYPFTLTLKNNFSDVKMETLLLPKVVYNNTINVTDVSADFGSGILPLPTKLKITTTGKATLTYKSGNCCDQTPKVDWNFLSSPTYFPAPTYRLLSSTADTATATTNTSCTIVGKERYCSTSVDIKASNLPGPNMDSPPADISANVNFGGSSNPSCKVPSANSTYIPVINLPNISFLMSESIWLDIPPPTNGSTLNPKSPRVAVRADYAPIPLDPSVTEIKVDVVNNLNPSEVFCTLSFPTNPAPDVTKPVDQFCTTIPSTFSGKLALKKNPASVDTIKAEYDPSITASHIVRMEGTTVHTFCQNKLSALTSLPTPSLLPVPYTIPSTLLMQDSPYGTTSKGLQDPQNDYGYWTAGRTKIPRCYDQWWVNDKYNKQDYYDLYKYNKETLAGTSYPKVHSSISFDDNPTDGYINNLNFSKFIFASNMNLSSGKVEIDPMSPNSPTVYMILQEGSEGAGILFGLYGTTGIIRSKAYPYTVVTNQLCSGDSALSKIKVLQTRMGPELLYKGTYMTGTDNMVQYDLNGIYSYLFICTHSHWNPLGKTINNWVD